MKSIYILLISLADFSVQSVSAQIGNPAPDFTVTDTEGNTHRLYDYLEAGRTVILDFYYTTCVPCQFYSPQVNLAYEKYGCNNAETFFMAIDYDDTNAEVEAYDEEYNIQYPSVSGLNGGGNAVVNDYDIIGFPTFYVIDSTKKIVEVIDPPTLQVFDFRFGNLGIEPAICETSILDIGPSTSYPTVIPNPLSAGSELNVYFNPGHAQLPAQFTLYNSLGQEVENGYFIQHSNWLVASISENMLPGIYFLRFNNHESEFPAIAFMLK